MSNECMYLPPMGDLISRSALKQDLLKRSFYPVIVKRALEDAPAVDAVPVVRCKECKHRDWRQNPEHGKVETICKHPCGLKHPGKDKFCSCGERKEQ